MRRINVAGLIGVSHLSKLLVALLVMKMIAVSMGPAGLGFLGNYMSLISIASAFAGGGVITGVVKYLSEYNENLERQHQFAGSALVYCTCFSFVILFLGLFFLNTITLNIFGHSKYNFYILLFLLAQILAAFNNLVFGIFNGHRETFRYSSVIIVGNVITLIVAKYCISRYGLSGAIVALTMPIVAPLLPVFYFYFKGHLKFRISSKGILKDFNRLSRFSFMLMISAVCFPVVEILIRKDIINNIGLDESGIWQALIRLSTAYLSFFSIFLSFYLVPIASATSDKNLICAAVKKTMAFLTFIFLCLFSTIFLYKNFFILLVFSPEFLDVGDHFVLQMVGDYFRIMGWVIGFVVVAKASTKLYICGEIFQGLGFVTLSYFLLAYFGTLQGVVLSYAFTCIAYFMVSVAGFLYYLKKS
jgi:PST family polysaccharide transporter/antigen flippase